MVRKFIRLTPKQRKQYNRRLTNLSEIRKTIKEERASGIRSILGASKNTKREIPASIIPREHKKRRFHSQKEYREEMRSLKRYKTEKEYFRENYKKKILDLWKDKINDVNVQISGKEIKPEGRFGVYSDEQKEQNKEIASYMDAYNNLQKMSVKSFKRAYFEGFIVPFKYIYGELTRFGNIGGGQGYSATLDRQVDLINEFKESGREE